MIKIQNNNTEILSELFFKELLQSLNSIKNEKITIGLSGGSSVMIFYNYLKLNYKKIPEKIRKKIIYCFLDERVVPLDNDDSNYKLLNDNFFNYLLENKLILENQILKINLKSNNIALEYYERVKSIDIGLFGVGPDGHTCSLFPNNKLLENENIGFLNIDNSPKPPSKRITISKNMLSNIPNGFVFFIGDGKKEALNNFLNEKINYNKCPAKLVKKCDNNVMFTNLI